MPDTAKFVAGNLALDFHNTVSWQGDIPFEDNILEDYRNVVDWAVRAALLDSGSARVFVEWAGVEPERAAQGLVLIHELRNAVHRIFEAVAVGGSPPPGALASLNDWIMDVPLRLAARDGEFAWDWTLDPGDPLSVMWPVVWSAATLLQSDQLDRVGVCNAERCGWLFVDQSRRHNRKWCQMEVCGNRAKAQRHYHRKRQG